MFVCISAETIDTNVNANSIPVWRTEEETEKEKGEK